MQFISYCITRAITGFFFLLFNEMLSSVAAVCSLVAAFSVRELGQSSSADAKKRLVWDSGVINF